MLTEVVTLRRDPELLSNAISHRAFFELEYTEGMFNFFSKKTKNVSDFAKFVGFFTAHVIWQLEGGENVVPLLATQMNGKRKIERIESSTYEQAVESGRGRVNELKGSSDYILFAYDGFLTLKTEKLEAIFIEAFMPNQEHVSTIHLSIPYRNAKSDEGLAIYRPKVMSTTISDQNDFFTNFYSGVDSHKKASEFWNKFLDQSK